MKGRGEASDTGDQERVITDKQESKERYLLFKRPRKASIFKRKEWSMALNVTEW